MTKEIISPISEKDRLEFQNILNADITTPYIDLNSGTVVTPSPPSAS